MFPYLLGRDLIDQKTDAFLYDKAFRTEPIGLSDWDLWLRLSRLTAADPDNEYVYPAGLQTDDGWRIVIEPYDPRVHGMTGDHDDRVIGRGDTVPEALAQAEEWARTREGFVFCRTDEFMPEMWYRKSIKVENGQ